jgi:hypothetical protein
MGGPGSGRWSFSGRPTCEARHAIDLAHLRRRGLLNSGHSSTLSWSQGGRAMGSVTLTAQHDGVRLAYSSRDRSGVAVDVDEHVSFAYTATMFGGRRQWFQCPRCGRGCRKLYAGRHFRCRRCHGLAYASQSEPADRRAMGRAEKIAQRLHVMWGGATEADYEFPPKPPKMRWATYRRLEEQYDELQGRWAAGAMARLGLRHG